MCWNIFDVLARLLRGFCGGFTTNSIKDEAEQESLLSRQTQQGSPMGSQGQQFINRAQMADAHATAAPLLAPTKLIVMRHGHRQDEEDAFWHETASRPWDPPLSAKGKIQAKEIASKMQELGQVDVIISSPFRRCLQTSAALVRELNMTAGSWLIDWQLSEICDPRVLFASRSDAKDRAGHQPIETWMWSGQTLEEALDKFVTEDCKLNKVPIGPVPRPTQPPKYPETLEGGLRRYSGALQDIARGYAGLTVLVVTHGECVRQAVVMAEPYSEVFEVKHVGYVVLSQQQQQQQQGPPQRHPHHPASHAHPPAAEWCIDCEPGETGVLWLEDDD